MNHVPALNHCAGQPGPDSGRRGVTLLEVATVIAVMGIVGGVGLMMGMLVSPVRFAKSAHAQIDRLQSLDDVAVRFRSDVATAVAVDRVLGPYRTSAATMILRYDSEAAGQAEVPVNEAEARHVIWHWESGNLWRMDWDGQVRRQIPMTTAGLFEAVSFEEQRSDGHEELTVRLIPRYNKKYRGQRAVFVISAVRGTDRL